MIGITPGMIGTSIPTRRAAESQSKNTWLSKNSCVIRNVSPASTLVFRNARSAARSGASGWTSGKHAPPIPNSKRSEMNAESATEDGRPLGAAKLGLAAGRVAAQREHVFEAGAVDVAQDLLQALRRLGDAAQVGHRLDPELALDRARDLHRSSRVAPPAP